MPSLRDALSKSLRKMKLNKIYEAIDGDRGFEKAISHAEDENGSKFDLIFTDFNMPNCTGLELLKRLRESPYYEDTPIFMVTTENEASIVLESIEAGASEYIIKPFQDDTVKTKVLSVMKKNKMI
jgi:two-component system chemotaxis response regulator CheY